MIILTSVSQSVQLLSCIWLFETPWIAACQASLSITNSQSSLKLMSIEAVMPSSHLILCRPLLLPAIPPSISLFQWVTSSHEVAKVLELQLQHQSFQRNQGWSPSEWTGWITLQSKGLSRVFSITTVQKHQLFGAQPSSQSNSHIHTWPQEKHKLESRLPGEISVTSDMQMTPPLWQKAKKNWRASWWKWKRRVKKLA